MSLQIRHLLTLGVAAIFLCGSVFFPQRWLSLVCAGLCLLCMLFSILLTSFFYKSKLNILRGKLASYPEAGNMFANGYESADVLDLTTGALEKALQANASLRKENEVIGSRANQAEEQAAQLSEALLALKQKFEHDEEQHKTIAVKTDVLYASILKLVQSLSRMVGSVAQGVAQQRFRMDEASSAMDLISNHVDQIASSAGSASEQAQGSREVAITGVEELKVAVDAIEEVKERTLALKNTMTVLGEKADNIGRVVGFINDVADQTNLLALNAAIEAARAGEAGRGFAVVADEVRNLAKKTMQATSEVTEAVTSIQTQTQATIAAVEDAADQTVKTANRAATAGSSMQHIVQNMENAAEQLENIAHATREQSQSSHQTDEALANIRDVALDTSNKMEIFTSSLVRLTSEMEDLGVIANALKTGDLGLAASEKLVDWTNSLATGFKIIDEQHKMLLNYINSLHSAMRRGVTPDQLLDILNVLYDYTVSHFSTEEQYFSRSDYRDTQKHIDIHRQFTKQIADYQAAVANGSAQVSMELLNFLKDWLIHHIQGTDHQYVDSVARMLRNEHSRG